MVSMASSYSRKSGWRGLYFDHSISTKSILETATVAPWATVSHAALATSGF